MSKRARTNGERRDPNEFTKATIIVLAQRAGQHCSNPDCQRSTSGGHSQKDKATIIGEAAHICGKQPGSARYDDAMTPELRRDIENGIWLCNVCHKMIDTDRDKYPVALLRKWKKEHEDTILENSTRGRGGRGGKATIIGKGMAIGGKGGDGGVGGKGGDGGDAHSEGDGLAMGGEGGEAGQEDRGGKGGRAPLQALKEDYPDKYKEIAEIFGITDEMAEKYGKGGDGADKK